ncbi:MAG: hypothetical protein HS115_01150 [Spirochaetales bacterium]|nr:hypothetical protein [Spirochaetales bacterium]
MTQPKKAPWHYVIFGILNSIYALAAFLFAAAGIAALKEGQQLDGLLLATGLIVAGLWLISTSVVCIRGQKEGSAMLAIQILILLAVAGYLMTLANDSEKTALALVLGLILLPPVFLNAVFLAFPGSWRASGGFLNAFSRPVIIGASLALAIPALTYLYGLFARKEVTLIPPRIFASSELRKYPARDASDEDFLTWWTPARRSGINEWIKLEFDEFREVEEIRLLAGAHHKAHPEYGDLYTANSRLKSGEIVLTGEEKIPFELEDKNELQSIDLGGKKTRSLKIIIHSTFKGERWDDLCISHIEVVGNEYIFKR